MLDIPPGVWIALEWELVLSLCCFPYLQCLFRVNIPGDRTTSSYKLAGLGFGECQFVVIHDSIRLY